MIGIFHEIASSSCSMYFLECPNLFQIKNHQTSENSYFQFASKHMETIFHFLFTKNIVLNFTHMIPILLKLSMMQRSCFLGCRDVIVWCCRGAVGRTYRKGNMENGNRQFSTQSNVFIILSGVINDSSVANIFRYTFSCHITEHTFNEDLRIILILQ